MFNQGDLVKKVGEWERVHNGTLGEVLARRCTCGCHRVWVKFVGHEPMGVLPERIVKIPALPETEKKDEEITA